MVEHPSPDEISGEFLTLDDGQVVTLEIASPTASIEWRHWTKDGFTECKGEKCGMCFEGRRRSGRFVIDVLVDGERKVWGFGSRLWRDILQQTEEPPSLEGARFRLKREGEGRATRWLLKFLGYADARTEPTPDDLENYLDALCADLGVDKKLIMAAVAKATGPIWDAIPLSKQLERAIRYIEEHVKELQPAEEEPLKAKKPEPEPESQEQEPF